MIRKIADGIQSGEKIQIQLQVATTPQPPNFKTKNIRNKIAPKPNPLSLLFSDIMLTYEQYSKKPN